MGLQHDLESIKNFEECWSDFDHPVFCSKDHSSWRATNHKYARWHYNHTHGDAYFVIPPYPFPGEIGGYNFFISREIFNWYEHHGKLSPLNSFTVINANDRFSQYLDTADSFIKDELAKRKIKVEYGLKLTGLDKETQMATFEDVKTGSTQ